MLIRGRFTPISKLGLVLLGEGHLDPAIEGSPGPGGVWAPRRAGATAESYLPTRLPARCPLHTLGPSWQGPIRRRQRTDVKGSEGQTPPPGGRDSSGTGTRFLPLWPQARSLFPKGSLPLSVHTLPPTPPKMNFFQVPPSFSLLGALCDSSGLSLAQNHCQLAGSHCTSQFLQPRAKV